MVPDSLPPIFKATSEQKSELTSQYKKTFDCFTEMMRQESVAEFDSTFLRVDHFHSTIFRSVWTFIQPDFYCLFWNLSFGCINNPTELYEEEIAKLATFESLQFKDSNFTSKSLFNREKARTRTQIENLEHELQISKTTLTDLENFVDKQKDELLNEVDPLRIHEISKWFVQICLLPRIIQGKTEALYCIRFIHLVARKQVKNFYFLDLVQKIIVMLVPAVTALTENEAKSLGFFIFKLFMLLDYWKEPQNFSSECENNSCFSRETESFKPLDLRAFEKVIDSLKKNMCSIFVDIFDSLDNLNV